MTRKKKKKRKLLYSFSYLSPFNFKFSSIFPSFSSPFSLFPCLSFPFLLFFLSLPFFPLPSFPPSFQNCSPNFPRVIDSPTSPTRSYVSAYYSINTPFSTSQYTILERCSIIHFSASFLSWPASLKLLLSFRCLNIGMRMCAKSEAPPSQIVCNVK